MVCRSNSCAGVLFRPQRFPCWAWFGIWRKSNEAGFSAPSLDVTLPRCITARKIVMVTSTTWMMPIRTKRLRPGVGSARPHVRYLPVSLPRRFRRNATVGRIGLGTVDSGPHDRGICAAQRPCGFAPSVHRWSDRRVRPYPHPRLHEWSGDTAHVRLLGRTNHVEHRLHAAEHEGKLCAHGEKAHARRQGVRHACTIQYENAEWDLPFRTG